MNKLNYNLKVLSLFSLDTLDHLPFCHLSTKAYSVRVNAVLSDDLPPFTITWKSKILHC